MDNFKIIYKILSFLEKSMDYEEIEIKFINFENLGITRMRWEEIFIMLSNSGYITGITVEQSLSDYSPRIVEPIKPRITLKGLEYLQENSMMKKAYRLAKGIKETTPFM